MSTARVKVGIAGLGRMGARHARNLATRVPRAELVAAVSPVEQERSWAQTALGVPKTYDDFAAMLRHPGLDAVCIATPTSEHAAQIIQALEAGKHVFCEKPTSLRVDDCLRVEEVAAKRSGQKVLIGYVRRFDASYRDAYDKVQRGLVGKPFLVRSHTLDKNDPSGFFVRFAPTSGGIFADMSVHDVDVARWFLGRPKPLRVFATGTVAIHEGLRAVPDLDNGLALCEFDDGKIAYFQCSRTMAHGHETATEVVGTAGRLSIGANPRLDRVDIADQYGVRNECTPTFYERFEEAFVNELNAFVEAIRDDTPAPVTLADATEATRIGVALQQSARERRVVEL
jgi:myo-inositol 2-dehydrogenase/D-chiro-inositol 1-dehydrogenase